MKRLTRVLALLLALILTLSIIPGTAAAEDETVDENDTYVLQQNVTGSEYTGPNVQYASPYLSTYNFDGTWHTSKQCVMYSMYNSISKQAIPAYCMDLPIGAYGGKVYHRLNLEDSTYASSIAGRIRAILLEGFYIIPGSFSNEEQHRALITAKTTELGRSAGVENLTIGEAITATQCAIWEVVHGSHLEFSTFASMSVYTGIKYTANVFYATICAEEVRDPGYPPYSFILYSTLPTEMHTKVNSNIQAVYNYLLTLTPVSANPKNMVVSPASFTNLSDPVWIQNTDGSYTVTLKDITVDVNLNTENKDWLKLIATVGESTYATSVDLTDGMQTFKTLTIENVPATLHGQDVYLTISGYQTTKDYVMFDAKGDRGTSQTMVGYDNSRLPVFAKVLAQEMRIVKIHKITNSGKPIGEIIFDIYPDSQKDQFFSSTPAEYTVITDKNGLATLNLTQMGLPDGKYWLVERLNDDVVVGVQPPIAVDIPGNGYVVDAYVKNQLKKGPEIEKDVIKLDNDKASVDMNTPHTWIISSTILSDIASCTRYEITDVLDSRLDYVGNLRVILEDTNGNTTSLAADGYTQEYNAETRTLTLALTDTGRTNAAGNAMLRVYFDAKINATAEMGAAIPNQATLMYNDKKLTSDKPVVYTGGIGIKKVDADDRSTVLPGAEFDLYRLANDIESGTDAATDLPGVTGKVIKVATGLTTDANGMIVLSGYAYGTYYLVETQAPAGYNKLGSPVELIINESSHLEDHTRTIENKSGTVLPETGGIGTTAFTLTGSLLVAASLLLLLEKKRRAC